VVIAAILTGAATVFFVQYNEKKKRDFDAAWIAYQQCLQPFRRKID